MMGDLILIGVAGRASSGKDTITEYLRGDFRFQVLSFVTPTCFKTCRQWLSAMMADHNRHNGPACVVISDVRFENEAQFIRDMGGLMLHVERNDVAKVCAHASEAGVAIRTGDVVISNDGTLDDLYARIDDVVLALMTGV